MTNLIHTASRVHFEKSWTQPVIPTQSTITYQTAWKTRLQPFQSKAIIFVEFHWVSTNDLTCFGSRWSDLFNSHEISRLERWLIELCGSLRQLVLRRLFAVKPIGHRNLLILQFFSGLSRFSSASAARADALFHPDRAARAASFGRHSGWV
ncbi:MAG TPA: hypothetical protein VGS10_07750, partial [Terracidiphilus sp.]|nr:hypothetical protein [Terracidiphilus sp.]